MMAAEATVPVPETRVKYCIVIQSEKIFLSRSLDYFVDLIIS